MFEHALSQTPADHAKAIYLQYALLEEQHGLAKHAMEVGGGGGAGDVIYLYGASKTRPRRYLVWRWERGGGWAVYSVWCIEGHAAVGAQSTPPPVCIQVYARAVRLVPKAERMAVYDLYLSKASEFFGIGKVRPAAGLGWCV